MSADTSGPQPPQQPGLPLGTDTPAPDFTSGHRARLRARFLDAPEHLPDYELLEIILFAAHPRGDVKPLAKRLLGQFKTLRAVLDAPPLQLMAVEGLNQGGVASLKTVREAMLRMLRQTVADAPVIRSWTALIDYCRLRLGADTVESLHILYLNHAFKLLTDEVQQRGTINHTAIYPREIVRRALELGAAHIIMVHNHPSGDTTPSKADIAMTREVAAVLRPLSLSLVDHLIVGYDNHFSFKASGLLE